MTSTFLNNGFEVNAGRMRYSPSNFLTIGGTNYYYTDTRYYQQKCQFLHTIDAAHFRLAFNTYTNSNYISGHNQKYWEVGWHYSGSTPYGFRQSTEAGWSFTGKHICTVELDKITSNENLLGLIVESTSRYMNFASGQPNQIVKPSIDDSVPIVTLSKQDKSKKVFGVISIEYDKKSNPHLRFGFNYESIYQNENRYEINSIGEGGIWICNKNGPLENGDFITSSTVPGYGMVQDDDLNHNYTVGKITCDCDFSLTKVKQSELVYTIDASDNKILTYDEKGHVQYKDLVDESGNVIYDYPLMTRYVQADGTILEDQTTYESKKAANEEVYIACFVGCVYMCG